MRAVYLKVGLRTILSRIGGALRFMKRLINMTFRDDHDLSAMDRCVL